jgi:hypothetical protein
MEHAQLAEIAALIGALGAVLALITRGGIFPLTGLGLLGVATGGLAWALVGDDDVKLLLEDPAGIALVAVGVATAILGAVPLARYPAAVPVALLAPFRVPVLAPRGVPSLLLSGPITAARSPLVDPPPRMTPAPVPARRLRRISGPPTSFLRTDERAGGIVPSSSCSAVATRRTTPEPCLML